MWGLDYLLEMYHKVVSPLNPKLVFTKQVEKINKANDDID